MVVIGGITRLTDSGLSMVDWSLVEEAFTLNQTDWLNYLININKHLSFKINSDYTLKDFKFIFLGILARMIGRLLGLYLFFYILIKKRSNKKHTSVIILFSLGSSKNTIGWWMVKSGLVDRPDVNPTILCTSNFWLLT